MIATRHHLLQTKLLPSVAVVSALVSVSVGVCHRSSNWGLQLRHAHSHRGQESPLVLHSFPCALPGRKMAVCGMYETSSSACSVPVLRAAAKAPKSNRTERELRVASPSFCHTLESIFMNLENSLCLPGSPGGFSYNQQAVHYGLTAMTEPKLQCGF